MLVRVGRKRVFPPVNAMGNARVGYGGGGWLLDR